MDEYGRPIVGPFAQRPQTMEPYVNPLDNPYVASPAIESPATFNTQLPLQADPTTGELPSAGSINLIVAALEKLKIQADLAEEQIRKTRTAGDVDYFMATKVLGRRKSFISELNHVCALVGRIDPDQFAHLDKSKQRVDLVAAKFDAVSSHRWLGFSK